MPNSPGGASPEPPSLEKRLPLALGLMMVVLLVSQYVFKPSPAPTPAKPANEQQQTSPVAEKSPAAPASSTTAAETAASAAGEIQASSEILTAIDSSLYHIVFTNRGALARTW